MVDGLSEAAKIFLAGPHRPFIDGDFRDVGGKALLVDDSATADIVAEVPDGGANAIDAAVAAARRALDGPWSRLRPVEREKMMLDLAEAVARDADLLAEIESIENGKALGMAKMLSVGGPWTGCATTLAGPPRSKAAPSKPPFPCRRVPVISP